MPSIRDIYPEKWLKATHLQGHTPTVTIARVRVEPLFNPRTRQPEPRLIVTFHGKRLELVLNKTQAFRLAELCGTEEYSQWVGHQVVLAGALARNNMPTIQIDPVDAPAAAPPADVDPDLPPMEETEDDPEIEPEEEELPEEEAPTD